MKGKYHIIVQNNKVKFEFDIKRNITIVRGNSATGKTTLVSLIDTYDRLGADSGIEVLCKKRCLTINNSNWEYILNSISECIVFIDEETTIVKSDDFARKIRETDNYYVIITRENLPNLPYSVEEVYGIHNSGRYSDMRRTYNSFYQLYTTENSVKNEPVEIVIAEDSNSGHEFFKAVTADDISCISAGGKTKIKRLVNDNKGKKLLIIADGAAFGSEMGELYRYIKKHPEVSLYLPESFEWLILKSGLIDGNRIVDILQHTEDYLESSDFFSWERFFTKLLISETEGTYLQYSKQRLNEVYLNAKEKEQILSSANIIRPMLGNTASTD
ncbi:MAG: translation initiation factor 2 [Ruminococcus sp.]|nr:translation initiation factor 2 [Ruminococcus sp.]